MKLIQHIALALGVVSLLINVVALVNALSGHPPPIPGIFMALHVGIFICFIPAVRSKQKVVEEQTRSLGFIERAGVGGRLMWKGVKVWPFIVLWFYMAIAFLAQEELEPLQDQPPWLPFSVGWMVFYYLSWALLRQEVQRRETAV